MSPLQAALCLFAGLGGLALACGAIWVIVRLASARPARLIDRVNNGQPREGERS
ncbi:hypothetical protein [Nonomuraea guangzhouensis]|uniref:Uncharacterized protein n=1 Tax=Nonomuraea guangzhouensis TaxID=1291555 RepID=A0ABW4H0I4_9ACTN|nr:hypothetical protein [Nonomuraea guangzhouensis]